MEIASPNKTRVLVVGLGKIGMMYDYYASPKKAILTHSQAIYNHPSFILDGGVDIDFKRRKLFEKKFSAKSFKNIKTAFIKKKPNLVVISTNINQQFDTFKKIIKYPSVKIVLCEKPFALNIFQAKKMIRLAKTHNISIFVNYIRLFQPSTAIVIKTINSRKIGNNLVVWAHYNNGIFNNGSHIINLINKFMGKKKKTSVLSKGKRINSYDHNSILKISYDKGLAYFFPINKNNFSAEFEIVGSKGRLYYSNRKIKVNRFNKNKKTKEQNIKQNMKKYQYYVYQNIKEFLDGKTKSICDETSAMDTLKTLSETR